MKHQILFVHGNSIWTVFEQPQKSINLIETYLLTGKKILV